jgi:hypothetical protein
VSARSVVDEEAFVADWETGVPLAVMAVAYGISDSTVSKVARRMGLAGRMSRWAPREVTADRYALAGGAWVPSGTGTMVWQPARA